MAQYQRFIKPNNSQNANSLPLLNSLFTERFSKFSSYGPDNSFKTYMHWIRKSPQLIGFLNIIATDILSDEMEFIPLEQTSSGRNKILRAKAFWMQNKGLSIAEETLYDMLGLGIGYNWMGTINNAQLKEFCNVTVREIHNGSEVKELEYKASLLYKDIKQNNTSSLAKKIRHIAASTVTMHTNQYEVLDYIQRVGVDTREFKPEEIIVFKLMPLDGKVYPFPPMEALLSEVYLLWLITQNYVSFFENGGKPDNVFILPKELAGSKNHQYLIDTLRKYKKIQNKHGNLVFTGDLSIEKLMDVEHQMENKDLGLYLVSILAMMYGVPIARIPFLVGKAASGGDAGGLADSGYWRKISVWQSKIEAAYNLQLWNPYFGVDAKFRRGYLQDEVRETQNQVQMNSVAEQRIRLGLWTVEAAAQYLKIDEEIVQEAQKQKKEREAEEMKSGMLLQNQDNNNNIMKEPDNKNKAKQKQDTQLENQKKAGGKKINP